MTTDLFNRPYQFLPKPRKCARLPQLSKANKRARRYQAEMLRALRPLQ